MGKRWEIPIILLFFAILGDTAKCHSLSKQKGELSGFLC